MIEASASAFRTPRFVACIIAIFPSPNNAQHALYEFRDVKDLSTLRSVILFRNDLGTFIFGRSLGAAPEMLPAELELGLGQCALIARTPGAFPATTAMIVRSNGGSLARFGADSDLPQFFATIPDVAPFETPPEPMLPPEKRIPDYPNARLMPVTMSLQRAPRLYGSRAVAAAIVLAAVVIFVVLIVSSVSGRH